MIYNKPRDVKLRALPSIGSVIKKADSVKSKFTKEAKNDDADKLILLNEAVPQDNEATVNVVVPEKKSTPSKTTIKRIDTVEDEDFDIILTESSKKAEDDVIFDLMEMPVIEGIPMLKLPEEAPKPTETKHKEIVFIDTPSVEPAVTEVAEAPVENNIFDLADMPDIDGIPMLELKPVSQEKIQLLEDFVYEPVKEVKQATPYKPPRPDIDFEEPVYEPIRRKPVIETIIDKPQKATEIIEEVVIDDIPLLDDFVEEIVVEETPAVTEIVEDTIIDDIPLLDDFVEEIVTEEALAVAEVVEDTVAEDIPLLDDFAEEIATEEAPAVTEIVEDTVAEDIPLLDDFVEEIVTEEAPAVTEVVEDTVAEDTPLLEEFSEELSVEDLPESDKKNTEEATETEHIAKTDNISVVDDINEEALATTEITEAIAPPPFVQPKAKRGRKAKKKEKQQKNKALKEQPAKAEVIEKQETVQADAEAPKKEKKQKIKKSKPVITDKRRHLKKKGVKLKLKLKNNHDNRKEKRKANAKPFGKARRLKVASFFLMLYVGTALAFALPLRPTYSETEKRKLSEFPEFSTKALLSGDYFADIDTWFADTFPFRENLTKADTFIKSLYGFDSITIHGDVDSGDDIPDAPIEVPVTEKPAPQVTEPVTMPDDDELSKDNGDPNAKKPDHGVQELSAIVVAGDSAYEYYSFSQDVAPRFIDRVNKLDEIAKPHGKVYAMIIPTSMDITLNDALRAEVKSANQKKALDYFNASFKNTVAVDSIYDTLRAHRNDYIYFRADHHWTALGAYYSYEEFAKAKGIKPVPLSKYKTQTFDNFIGTFYSSSGQNPALKENPDYVTAYLPFNNTTCKISDSVLYEGFDYDIIKDVSDYTPGSKYLTFIGGDNGLTTITNLDLPRGESCLVIKDSYANAFVPFLIPHYNKVYVVDPRHYKGTLTEFCENKQVNDVIVLTNISTTRNYVYLEGLENFVQ